MALFGQLLVWIVVLLANYDSKFVSFAGGVDSGDFIWYYLRRSHLANNIQLICGKFIRKKARSFKYEQKRLSSQSKKNDHLLDRKCKEENIRVYRYPLNNLNTLYKEYEENDEKMYSCVFGISTGIWQKQL